MEKYSFEVKIWIPGEKKTSIKATVESVDRDKLITKGIPVKNLIEELEKAIKALSL